MGYSSWLWNRSPQQHVDSSASPFNMALLYQPPGYFELKDQQANGLAQEASSPNAFGSID